MPMCHAAACRRRMRTSAASGSRGESAIRHKAAVPRIEPALCTGPRAVVILAVAVSAKKSPPTVFVVDDDDSVRGSLRFLLRSTGLESRVFGSAHDFLAAYDPT